MSVQQEVIERALKIAIEQNYEEAQKFVEETFGKKTDLDIVKCDECGEILALVENLLARGLSGGDPATTLAIYRHMKQYPDHADMINGYSHGTAIPIGKTLNSALRSTAKKFNLTFMEALDKRIKHLEAKLVFSSVLRE